MGAVLVTGAGSGIGRATALTFAEAGWRVLCTDCDGDAATDTAATAGELAEALEVDVTDEGQCRDAVERASTLDELTAVIACAGINARAPAHEMNLELFEKVMSVNVTGTFLTARAAGRKMIEQGTKGSLVLVSSINAIHAHAGQAAYATSKAAVHMLAKTLAVDWAPFGIRVNAVGPGITDTPLVAKTLGDHDRMRWVMDRIPMRRVADPRDIAEVIFFLASDSARYMTGALVPVDGGWLTGA